MNRKPEDTFFDEVGQFHRKFGLPVTGENGPCIQMLPDVAGMRFKFLHEELEEFRNAMLDNDVPAMLDALVDLAWVAMGTAHYLGAPFNEAWEEIYLTNMQKVPAVFDPSKPYRGVHAGCVKPVGWIPPDLDMIIKLHNSLIAARKAR